MGCMSFMALVAWSCFMVRGYINPRTTIVRAMMASPKLLNRKLDSAIMLLIMGWRIIRSQIAPISN